MRKRQVGHPLMVVVSLLIVTSYAHAGDSSPDAFRAFGLEGVWSPDCQQPPSKENPRVVWRVAADKPVFHGVSFDGSTWALIDTVSGAEIVGDNLIRFSSIRNGAVFLTVTVERVGDRIHTTASVGANGEVFFRNGIEVMTGKPGMFDERCDIQIPIS